MTTGQFFVVKLDSCPRLVAGVQINNTPGRTTREFRVSGSQNADGPWQTLLEDELPVNSYTTLLNYTFEQEVEVQFLKFDVLSMWGSEGAGLQYFAAIPVTSE